MNEHLRSQILSLLLFVGVVTEAEGQQNLFNMPTSDITVKSKLFFQQQINLLNDGTAMLNSTFCYGLGGDFEVGFNVLGIFLNPSYPGVVETNSDISNPPVYPYFTINLQKALTLSKTFKVALGTQAGYSVGMHFGNFTYLNVVTAIPRYHLKLITGVNHGSESFLGPGDLNPLFSSSFDPIGYQVGLEQEILKEKLMLQAEHISGEHTLGVSVLGLGYHLTDHWILSAGYQFSSAGNNTPNSVIVEFTFVPSAVTHRRVYQEGHSEIR